MSCAAIMTPVPLSIQEDESVGEAVGKLVTQHHAHLPVVDESGRYAGMFGLDDLLGLLVPRVALAGNLMSNLRFVADDPEELRRRFDSVKNRRVREVTNRNAATLDPDASGIDAFRLFCRSHDSLAVVDKTSGRVVGMVSPWDAIRALARPAAQA